MSNSLRLSLIDKPRSPSGPHLPRIGVQRLPSPATAQRRKGEKCPRSLLFVVLLAFCGAISVIVLELYFLSMAYGDETILFDEVFRAFLRHLFKAFQREPPRVLPSCDDSLPRPFAPLPFAVNATPAMYAQFGRSKLNRMAAGDPRRANARMLGPVTRWDYRYECRDDNKRRSRMSLRRTGYNGENDRRRLRGDGKGDEAAHEADGIDWRFYTVNRSDPVVILEWANPPAHIGMAGVLQIDDGMLNCDVPCFLSKNKKKWIAADAIVFGAYDRDFSKGLVKDKPIHQYWAANTMEVADWMQDANTLNRFDLKMTVQLNSDVPRIYLGWSAYDWLAPPRPKTGKHLVSALISNCRDNNGRLRYMQELMRHIPVASFGKCVHTANASDVLGLLSHRFTANRGREKNALLSRHKFHLAFENTNLPDYVTEKFAQALSAGTVPIVLSRVSNHHSFAPPPKSYIVAEDFESPRKLADYLRYLDSHPREYNKYLSWKREPLSPSFRRLLSLNYPDSTCHLCRFLAAARDIDAGYVDLSRFPRVIHRPAPPAKATSFVDAWNWEADELKEAEIRQKFVTFEGWEGRGVDLRLRGGAIAKEQEKETPAAVNGGNT
ncbi:unnamed protein product [Vitrella brassicaformis CCMP3155]|uniref:Fucosyltransferase n=1 Tax=Vitrella brassicaformis (strain CCMP3155) TaxID=1169540 RepID=A0A0G4GV21_VITBC|nr:unnamed protein product [Vitrella brassicaformis CCMP3155]|eukprot:CEM34744.1 unnamed protein product [Vitrella brassicaformis CCMP3155]